MSYQIITDSSCDFTKEKYEEILQKVKTKEEQIMEFMKKDTKEMYLEDLYELKKKIK